MLVVSRCSQESITITVPPSAVPREIVVMVCRCNENRAWVGIEAPLDVNIVRSELERKPRVRDEDRDSD